MGVELRELLGERREVKTSFSFLIDSLIFLPHKGANFVLVVAGFSSLLCASFASMVDENKDFLFTPQFKSPTVVCSFSFPRAHAMPCT